MTKFSSLVDVLQAQAKQYPDQVIFRFLQDVDEEVGSLTFQELNEQAQAIAAQLQKLGKSGQKALLVYPYTAGLEFIAAFMGCLYAGVVAVTDNPPHQEAGLLKLQSRIESSEASVFLSTQDFIDTLQGAIKQTGNVPASVKHLKVVATDQVSKTLATEWIQPEIDKDTIAFLQYTSGSTGLPKGVRVSHENILHNTRVICDCFELTETDRSLFWLPLYHDMGLIGGVLVPIVSRMVTYLMSPVSFIQKPDRWVRTISQLKINVSGSANFAYDLLCKRVSDEVLSQLDLSSWDRAFTGAEPIRVATLEKFQQKFGACGFNASAFYPCYGMAETTLLLTGGKKAEAPKIDYVDRQALQNNQAMVCDRDSPSSQALVSCGTVHLGDQVKIVDPDTGAELGDRLVGEIWAQGKGIGQGYFNQREETEQSFEGQIQDQPELGHFLRTGDYGYLCDGELYITGRLKEMMILWGRNMYPQHIEQTAQSAHPDLEENGGAAFALELEGDERLIILQEVSRRAIRNMDIEGMVKAIYTAIATQHTASVYAIGFVKPRSLPKTTSGKVQRQAAKKLFQSEEFEPLFLWKATEDTTISDLLALAVGR